MRDEGNMTTRDPYQPPAAPIDNLRANATEGVAKCPKCGAESASKVSFTWWGGALGPKLFHVVKCHQCDARYNGRTGGKLTRTIIVYQLVVLSLTAGVMYFLFSGR